MKKMKYIMACLAIVNLGCLGLNIITGNYWIVPINILAFVSCGGAFILNS